MKRLLFYMMFVWAALPLFSQTITVLDGTNLQPLAGIQVSTVRLDPAIRTITDENGHADISTMVRAKAAFQVSGVGYQPQEFEVSSVTADMKVLLLPGVENLDELVVTAQRIPQLRQEVPQQVAVLSKADVQFASYASTADILSNSGQTFVQRSQGGGGSPILRGFEASRVLILMDGVRLNNAIFRAGHLQNVLTVGSQFLNDVELLYGPSSTVYGSDALGGVMHFHTLEPKLSSKSVGARLGYATANSETTGSLVWNLGGKRLVWTAGITYADYGDIRIGTTRSDNYPGFGLRPWYVERINGVDSVIANSDPNLQVQSAYQQYDLISKLRFQQNDRVAHTLTGYATTTSDIPRYDRLTETSSGNPRFGQWYYGPQQLLLASYNLSVKSSSKFFKRLSLTAAYQNVVESRHSRNFGSANLTHRVEEVDVLSINLDLLKEVGSHSLRYGLEAQTNDVTSNAEKENVNTGELSAQSTRYPDGGANMNHLALYLHDQYLIGGGLVANAGLRAGYSTLAAKFVDKSFFPFPFDQATQTNPSLNGNLGIVYNGSRLFRLAASAATGYRVPNVDDLTKVFDSAPGKVVFPNPNLGPERTLNFDLSARVNITRKAYIEAIGFYTRIQNGLMLEKGTFNGADSVDYDGIMSEVLQLTNQRTGNIRGLCINVNADLTKNFSLVHSLNMTQGTFTDPDGDIPLDHVPPTFGRTALRFNMKKLRTELAAQYAGWKRIEDYNPDGEDNLQYATPDGMPGWWTLNLNAQYQITKNLALQAAIDNLLDVHYRMFASGISAPGRNVRVSLRANF